MTNRGRIQFPERAKQIIDFSGLRYKSITPTDIDGTIDFRNKGFVFYEFKYENAEMPLGQRIALQRLADDCQNAGKEAVVFLCSHNVKDVRCVVDAANAKVIETYYKGRWKKEDGKKTAKQRTDSFLEWIELNPLI